MHTSHIVDRMPLFLGDTVIALSTLYIVINIGDCVLPPAKAARDLTFAAFRPRNFATYVQTFNKLRVAFRGLMKTGLCRVCVNARNPAELFEYLLDC